MFKRSRFTTITPLPSSIKRESVMAILHNHVDMIHFNPLVVECHPITPPDSANTEECLWQWYRIHDGFKMGYLKYDAGLHDLQNGVESLAYAPLRVQTRSKWTLGETLPGEQPVDGAPEQGLWLSEDVEIRCPILFTWFTKRTLKKAHVELMHRFIAKAERLSEGQQQEDMGQQQQEDIEDADRSSSEVADQQSRESLLAAALDR